MMMDDDDDEGFDYLIMVLALLGVSFMIMILLQRGIPDSGIPPHGLAPTASTFVPGVRGPQGPSQGPHIMPPQPPPPYGLPPHETHGGYYQQQVERESKTLSMHSTLDSYQGV